MWFTWCQTANLFNGFNYWAVNSLSWSETVTWQLHHMHHMLHLLKQRSVDHMRWANPRATTNRQRLGKTARYTQIATTCSTQNESFLYRNVAYFLFNSQWFYARSQGAICPFCGNISWHSRCPCSRLLLRFSPKPAKSLSPLPGRPSVTSLPGSSCAMMSSNCRRNSLLHSARNHEMILRMVRS